MTWRHSIACDVVPCICKEDDLNVETPQILDACCGGRMWWWDKDHPLAVYMDRRVRPAGFRERQPNWACEPDVVGDFRAMPFEDGAFHLVLFDPPHVVQHTEETSEITRAYGQLKPGEEQDDLRRGFAECWRVLKPGGTLVFKWAGPLRRVETWFPTTPIVGTRRTQDNPKWLVFYKPLPT